MLGLLIRLPFIVLLAGAVLILSIARATGFLVLMLAAVIVGRRRRILEAWSQRSGGRAARAEHEEIATVLA